MSTFRKQTCRHFGKRIYVIDFSASFFFLTISEISGENSFFFLLVRGWARRTMLIWYVMIPNKVYLSKMPRSNKPWGMYVHLNQIISFSMPLAGNSRSLRYLSLHALISYLFMIFFLGQIFLWSWIPNESPTTWLVRSLPLLKKGGPKNFVIVRRLTLVPFFLNLDLNYEELFWGGFSRWSFLEVVFRTMSHDLTVL